MKVTLTLIKIICIGCLFIISNNNLHITEQSDRIVFTNVFHAWLSDLFSTTSQITGYVIDSRWLPPDNSAIPETIKASPRG
jgi:hypothetical protein